MEGDKVYKQLGERIRNFRKSTGQTQEQLAKQVGISRSSLTNIELGRQKLLVHHLYSLATSLQLNSPTQLIVTPHVSTSKEVDALAHLKIGTHLTEKQRQGVVDFMSEFVRNSEFEKSEEDE